MEQNQAGHEPAPAQNTVQTPPADALSPGDALRALSKPEDISDYAAERNDQREEESGAALGEKQKTSRSSRYKRARDAAIAERDAARAELAAFKGKPAEASPDTQAQADPIAEAIEAGRSEHDEAVTAQETERALVERGAFQERVKSFEKVAPDFAEVMQSASGETPIPEHVGPLIVKSEYGPQIMYALAKTPGASAALQSFNAIDAARWVGAMEAGFMRERGTKAQPQFNQVSKAPPPIKRLEGGGATPSKSLNDLARSDDASDYIRARSREA